jgi:hypothetical protein
LQSPAFLLAAQVEADTGNPFAGNAPPSGLFVAWAIAYGTVWWLLADRWFRRRDL